MVDRVSFILGMITAFGECVAQESKRIAFSPPFYPKDLESLQDEAERICQEQELQMFLEKNLEMPEDSRVYWWVLYKFPEDLEEYQDLREKGSNPAWEFSEFGSLLSYGTVWGAGAENVVMRMRKQTTPMDPVTRILFPDGGWPVEKVQKKM